jgi:hypothetical protein
VKDRDLCRRSNAIHAAAEKSRTGHDASHHACVPRHRYGRRQPEPLAICCKNEGMRRRGAHATTLLIAKRYPRNRIGQYRGLRF